MALTKISDIRKRTGIKLPKAPKSTKPVPYDPVKQVEGYKTRLEAAGTSPEKLENRNFLERTLNLKENQPWWFDIFEVINRPQQALFGGISSGLKGEDIFKGTMEGLSGNKFTTGKDLIEQSGIKDALNLQDVKMEDLRDGQGWWESINLIDVAGLALDVWFDPIDAALWSASIFTGGASAAVSIGLNTVQTASKTVQALDAATDFASYAKLLDISAARKAISLSVKSDLGKGMIKALDVMKSAKTVGDFRTAAKTFEDIANTTRKISTLNLLFRGAGKGVSYSLNFADNAVIKLLSKVDDFALADPKFAAKVARYGEAVLNVSLYKNAKDMITNVFNASAKINQELWGKIRGFKAFKRMSERQALAVISKNDEMLEIAAKAVNMDKEEFGKLIKNIIEFEDTKVTYTYLSQLTNSDTMLRQGMTADNVSKLKELLRELIYSDGNRVLDNKTIDGLFRMVREEGNEIYFIKYEKQALVKRKVEAYITYLKNESAKLEPIMSNIIKSLDIAPEDFFKLPISALNDDYVKANAKLDELSKFMAKLNTAIDGYKPTSAEFKRLYRELGNNPIVRQAIADFKNNYDLMLKSFDFFAGSKYARTMIGENGGMILPKSLSEKGEKLLNELPVKQYSAIKLKGNVQVSAERILPWGAESSNVMMRAMAKNMLESGAKFGLEQKRALQKLLQTNFFEEFLNSTLVDFSIRKSSTAFQAKMIEDIAVAGTFSDPTVVSVYRGFDVAGKRKILKSDLVAKIKNMKVYRDAPDLLDNAANIIRKKKGVELLIDEHIYDLLAVNQAPGTLGTLLELYDKVNNTFKATKLLRFAFHGVNFMGNLFNMLMNGVNPVVALSKSREVYQMMTLGPQLLEKAFLAGAHMDTTGQVLQKLFTNADELKIYQNLVEYIQAGLPEVSGMLFDYDEIIEAWTKLPKEKVGPIKRVLMFNAEMNERVDTMFRLTTFLYAKENPDILRRYNLSSAADLVRRVHFDPADLSNFEKNFMRRVIPFYTFTKKNLALQMKNLAQNPTAYNRLTKGMKGLWNLADIDINELEEYKSTNFWIPLIVDKDGKYTALKANLPAGDLVDFLTDPLNKVITSLSPFIRVPFELAANQQFFTGLPIQEFPGQVGFRTKGSEVLGIKTELPAWAEYGLAQTGIDAPVQTVADIWNSVSRTGQRIMGQTPEELEKPVGVFQSALSAGSVKKTKTAQAYDELRRLQDIVALYKQQNIKIPTLSEIENRNSPSKSLQERLKVLRNR